MIPTALLKVNTVSFDYPKRPVFTSFSVDVLHGLTIVTGEEACGKTSLLKLMAGQFILKEGDILLNGCSLVRDKTAYQKNIFWIDTQDAQVDQMQVNAFLSGLSGTYANWNASILNDAIDGLALRPHIEKQFFMLSTGTKRKVWLAAALAACQPLTLIDDAFAGVDQQSIRFFTHTLHLRLAESQDAWVISTYNEVQGVTPLRVLDLGAGQA